MQIAYKFVYIHSDEYEAPFSIYRLSNSVLHTQKKNGRTKSIDINFLSLGCFAYITCTVYTVANECQNTGPTETD